MKFGQFARSAVLMFLALRAGDAVSLVAGMWFVPKYVSPADIGAVLPLTSFATFLSLPVFAFAMSASAETARLAASGERGRVKSLLSGVFLCAAAATAVAAVAGAVVLPRFLVSMRVADVSAGCLAAAAAFLGCAAPVCTDALQALKRFRALAAVEFFGSVVRFAVMAVLMPVRALAGYFAGQAALPAFRIAASLFALKRDLAEPAAPYWNRAAVARAAKSFFAVLAYLAAPMFASLVEQSVLRAHCSAEDSAGYYMVSRFSDLLNYMTFPLLLVMFPYTAAAAEKGGDTRPYVAKCAIATMVAAAILAVVCFFAGERLLALMPNGARYAGYVRYMPALVAVSALTACQVFWTNAEVSAGRFGFLKWLLPLHIVYPAALWAAAESGALTGVGDAILWFAAAATLRFAFSAVQAATHSRSELDSKHIDTMKRRLFLEKS